MDMTVEPGGSANWRKIRVDAGAYSRGVLDHDGDDNHADNRAR